MSMAKDPSLIAKLQQHRLLLGATTLSQLFCDNPHRASHLQITAAGLTLDYSKNFCVDATLALFAEVVANAQLPEAVRALMSGAEVNLTERRAALHSALRGTAAPTAIRDQISPMLSRFEIYVNRLRDGTIRGFSGKPISDVVNIGIGGSDLGPRMVITALQNWCSRPHIHFVANIDPVELTDTLAKLDPETTLIITASKSFATLETRENSLTARAWLSAAAASRDISTQLVAITANPERARAFGIEDSNIFPMWDWVGGRFSLWSAIGLSIALAVGWNNFTLLLRGAAMMDEHYNSAPFPLNMPIMMALLECWYLNFWDAHSVATLPYAHRLRLFPAFLQQLSMESLGKSTTLAGSPTRDHTGAVVWGEAGTNSQHSFMQLLHQGTRLIPVDFILPLTGETTLRQQYAHLVANCLGQSRALMVGKSYDEVVAELTQAGMAAEDIAAQALHRVLPGNRPSNTITMDWIEPSSLGALIALYEHKVHAQSVLWNINAFDQWGVELGKKIEGQIMPALSGGWVEDLDPSTRHLTELFVRINSPKINQ